MSLTLDAPLLPPVSPELESALQEHLDALTRVARQVMEGELRAVVLGGSLARSHGVVLQSADTQRLLSDIDLYLVVRDPLSDRSRRVEGKLREIHEAGVFSGAGLDLGVVAENWFRSLSPSLPAHQLVHGHRVLWSVRDDFRLAIQSVDPRRGDRVDKDDALILVMNRFAEHLLLVESYREADPEASALYHRWKLCLDVPLAWLALRGRYHPDRGRQREQLAEIWETLGRPRPSWWAMGIQLMESIHEKMCTGTLDVETMSALRPEQEWEGIEAHLEALGEVRRARIPELNWVWPFYRDGLRVCLGLAHADPGLGLQRAVEDGMPGPSDLVLALKWLRRRSPFARLREARRWVSHAPEPVTPWYRHAIGGSAPERVQMACALRFGGLNSWKMILEDLLPDGRMEQDIPIRGEELDLWLGRQWSGWVMRGSRS